MLFIGIRGQICLHVNRQLVDLMLASIVCNIENKSVPLWSPYAVVNISVGVIQFILLLLNRIVDCVRALSGLVDIFGGFCLNILGRDSAGRTKIHVDGVAEYCERNE